MAAPGRANSRTLPIIRRDYQVCTVEYVLDGAGFLEINGHDLLKIEKDGVYFLPKHSDHCYYPDVKEPWNKLFFVVNGPLMESLLKEYKLSDCFVLENASSLKRFFLSFMAIKKSASGSDDAAALLFHEFVIACSGLLHRQEPEKCDLAEKLKEALEQDIAGKFVLSDYAESVNLSSEHLIRVFRSRWNVTPQAYRLQIRLNEAARLLAYSELSIKEIAIQCGFADGYSFSNSFRKHRQLSPLAYRRGSRS